MGTAYYTEVEHEGNGTSGMARSDRGTTMPRGPARARRPSSTSRNGDGEATGLATFLGWFSIGLGLAEALAPDTVARLIGVRDSERNRRLLRAMGLREITSGLGILTRPASASWMWSRVAGDAIDLSLLGTALASDEHERGRTAAATAAVLGVAALDVVCAQRLSEGASADQGIHVAHSVTINRPIEEVYDFWHDFENLPRFMLHLEQVRTTGDRRSHWKAKAPAGMSVEWDAVTTEDRPNELIAWRSVEGATVENSGSVRFRRAPGDRGTEVVVELHYDPPGGKVGASIAKLFREEPGQQVPDDLRRFKSVMETGEVLLSDATLKRGPHPAKPN
jgi:uncharacterized membrane protein